mgnify:CR=1 FL=1
MATTLDERERARRKAWTWLYLKRGKPCEADAPAPRPFPGKAPKLHAGQLGIFGGVYLGDDSAR